MTIVFRARLFYLSSDDSHSGRLSRIDARIGHARVLARFAFGIARQLPKNRQHADQRPYN